VPAPSPFEYVIVRVVPHVEREEFINAGAILFCHEQDYLRARIALDEKRLRAIAPHVDLDLVMRHLQAIPRICEGGALAGPIGRLTKRERWHWLVSARSTILQTSPSHAGLGADPEASLERLLDQVVRGQND
jgi:hypothetical protein